MSTVSIRIETIELPVLKIDKVKAILEARYKRSFNRTYCTGPSFLQSCIYENTNIRITNQEAFQLYDWFEKNNLV